MYLMYKINIILNKKIIYMTRLKRSYIFTSKALQPIAVTISRCMGTSRHCDACIFISVYALAKMYCIF